MRFYVTTASLVLTLLVPSGPLLAEVPIEKKTADIMSDGTRIHADIYRPKVGDQALKYPAIIMSHGWGGTANLLSETAADIAQGGFVVVVIDYRGWGRSDSRTIQVKNKDNKFGKTRELREVVDPLAQAEDIFSAINWAASDPQVEPSNIGLWGTSFSGGLTVYVAARDKRVKAIVSQVGSMGWGPYTDRYVREWNTKGGQRARGEIDYPQPGAKEVGSLIGGMVWEKLARFRPYEDADQLKNVAALFVVAKNEELFRNEDHSLAVFNKLSGAKEYLEIPNIKHYDIYSGPARKTATKAAINWFEKNLKNSPVGSVEN
jgi:dienelactone hydrolase